MTTKVFKLDTIITLVEALEAYKRLYEEVQPAGGWQGIYEWGNSVLEVAKLELEEL